MSSVLNQSVSSAYLNRRPTRNAPTLSISKLTNSGCGDSNNTNNKYASEADSQIERAILEAENPAAAQRQRTVSVEQ